MPETPQLTEPCPCICHMGPRPRGVLHSRACCPNWNGDLDGPAGDSLPYIEARVRRDERERAEKAEAALAQLHTYAIHRRGCAADGAGQECTCGLAAIDSPEPR